MVDLLLLARLVMMADQVTKGFVLRTLTEGHFTAVVTSRNTATIDACYLKFGALGSFPSGGTFYLAREHLQWRIDRIDAAFYDFS